MLNKNPILKNMGDWFTRNFSDPGALGLFFTLLIFLLVIEFFGKLLAPIIVSVALAYLLHTPVQWLKRCHFPNFLAVFVVYLVFIGLVIWAIVGLVPVLVQQLTNLVNEIPVIFMKAQTYANELMHQYPHLFNANSLQSGVTAFKDSFAKVGQLALSFSLSSISGVVTVVLYLILVPIMLFLFLKDSHEISHWMGRFMPSNRSLVNTVWSEVNTQIGNYVRGRIIEIVIISLISSVTFAFLGLEYAILLGVLVGVSVIVPYVGAVLVTIPVVIIASIQWGWSAHFAYTMVAYAIIIVLDGNVLVPLLFSEAMDLHPVAIIIAVLIFGGIWGFWGVFLAIPLATLVKAVVNVWPTLSPLKG
jgi:putative permease